MKRRHLFLPALLLTAACGTDVTGPSASLFSCVLAEPTRLAVGDVVQATGEENRGVCLSGADPGEFLYIPFHATAADSNRAAIEVVVDGFGVTAPFAAAADDPAHTAYPDLSGGLAIVLLEPSAAVDATGERRRAQDDRFHRRLRAQEQGILRSKILGGVAGERLQTARIPLLGELVDYNVAISCTDADIRTGRVEYVSDHAIVVADTANPVGLTALDYQSFALTFDTLVHPVAMAHFGEPSDIDGNERTIIFYTRAVNELSGPSMDVYTAGFFWSGDLFPEEDTPRAEACPAANQAEMFYMLAADPLGQAGPPYSGDFIRRTTVAVLAHEYQHLINAGRRLWVNEASVFEEPWLNEGLSHAAEELVFYEASGLSDRSNIDYEALSAAPGGVAAFNAYMAGNFTNYARYLERPDTASLMGIDNLVTRGASWNFLRYAADRSDLGDEAFFGAVVNSTRAGLENLREVVSGDPLGWMQDWTVSVFADDALPAAPEYTQPSWDLRDLYRSSSLGAFPLTLLPLEPDGTLSMRLHAGGAAFPLFWLNGSDAVLYVTVDGDAPPTPLRGSFVRIR